MVVPAKGRRLSSPADRIVPLFHCQRENAVPIIRGRRLLVFGGSLDVGPRGAVVGIQGEHVLEGRACFVPESQFEFHQGLVEKADDIGLSLVEHAFFIDELVDADGLRLAHDANPIETPEHDAVFRLIHGVLGDADPGSILLVDALEPRGEVHRIAHDRVVHLLDGAHVPDDHLAGVDSHAGQ